MNNKVYIIFSNNSKIEPGDYGEYCPVPEYITLNKEKATEYLEKERYKYFNTKDNEIDEDFPEQFSCNIGNWYYNYWIAEYNLDEQIH